MIETLPVDGKFDLMRLEVAPKLIAFVRVGLLPPKVTERANARLFALALLSVKLVNDENSDATEDVGAIRASVESCKKLPRRVIEMDLHRHKNASLSDRHRPGRWRV